MNSLGINDPRLIHLTKSISLLGYNVITPEIPEIKDFLINQDTLKSLNDFFEILEANIFYENISLFLVSFAGGMSLIPISNPKYKKIFKSIFCIGAYSSFETSIPYVLSNFDESNYGGYILLYNYIDLILKNSRIKKYFYDNIIYHSIKNTTYLRIKNNLSKHEDIFCDKIEKDFNFRIEVGQEILKKKKDLIKKLSPINYVNDLNLDFGIYLLHGNNDKIISKEESINIHQRISNPKKSKLLTTDLINHVSSSFNVKNFSQIPQLISFFNDFFNTI